MARRYWKKRGGFRRKRLAKLVKSVLLKNAERKVYQWNLTSTNPSVYSTWVTTDMVSAITQGTGGGQRIGNSISIRDFFLDGVLASPSGVTAESYNNIRLILWKGNFSIAPSTLLTYVTTVTPLWISGLAGSGIRKIMVDKQFTIQPHDVGLDPTGLLQTSTANEYRIRIYYKFKNPLKIRWNTLESGVPPNQCLYFSAMSDSAAEPHPEFIAGNFYMRYYDF